jgi:hypothetical protein
MTTATPASPRTVNAARPGVSDGPVVSTETITPAIAEQWLQLNARNRPLSGTRVATYARDMANGNWRLTGEAIQFDSDGNLIDGQHRLWAVRDSDATIEQLVVRGLPPETQDYIDTGQRRTMGHVLQIKGEVDPNVLAASAVLLWQWEHANKFDNLAMAGARNISHAEQLRVIDRNPDLRDAVAFARNRPIAGVSVSVRAFVLYKLRQIDADQADAFMADLSSMRTEGLGDPKSALLRRLASGQAEGKPLDRYIQAKALFRVWNAVRRGEQMQRLQTSVRNRDMEGEEPE